MRCWAMGLIAIGLSVSAPASAEHNPLDYVLTRTIQFTRAYHPWFVSNFPPDRVDIDLSLDLGTTWARRVAHGLPLQWGTNTYTWSFRVTPSLWTEHARMAVRTLWSTTTNALIEHEGSMSGADFTIAGLRILSPTNGTPVLCPGYLELRWHEAGPDYVTIGTSTDGVEFAESAIVTSTAPTNSYWLPIVNVPNGPLWICVQAYSNLYEIVQVQVAPNQ